MKPSLCPSLIATLLLCVTPGVLAQPGEGGSFFNPPLGTDPSNIFNPVWTLGQTQNIQWTTTLSNFTIFLYQQLGTSSATQGPGLFTVLPGHESATDFDWTVQTNQFELSRSNIFFLWLQPGPIFNGGGMTSRFFNISSSASSSSSTTAPSTISMPISASTSTAAPVTTTTPTTSQSVISTPQASNSSGLSSSAKVGLGVGITFGLLFIALGGTAVWYILRMRRNQLRAGNQHPVPEPSSKWDLPADRARYLTGYYISEMPQGEVQKSSELPGYRHVAELG